jgi:hypothetical protein
VVSADSVVGAVVFASKLIFSKMQSIDMVIFFYINNS